MPTLVFSQMGLLVAGIGCAFAQNVVTFIALRFTLALFVMATTVIGFVYGRLISFDCKVIVMVVTALFFGSNGNHRRKMENRTWYIRTRLICCWVYDTFPNGHEMEELERSPDRYITRIGTCDIFLANSSGITQV